jgi:hypothetical protein
MSHRHKRKACLKGSLDPSTVSTVPTLKEYIWKELTSIIQKHSTVPLSDRDISGSAMKKFRLVFSF